MARSYRSRGVGAAVFVLFAASGAGALEYIPLYSLTLLGGQYFFSGSKSSLNGNALGSVAPAVKFNERWTLLPAYNVAYQGTKQVTDAVGSGTLFQQLMDHRFSVMGIYASPVSKWRLKPNASYKLEYLKETRDEAWGKGLFDYRKIGLGLEAENVYKEPFSYRLAYDFYYVYFPNYQSLESKAGVDPNGNLLNRETAGKDVLDTFNQQVTFSATRPFPYNRPKVSLQAAYSVLWQAFPDQPIISRKGIPNDHDPKRRQDFIQSLSLNVAHPKPLYGGAYRLVSRFATGFSYDGSNQNTFDAGRNAFISDAYSYYSWSLGPAFTLGWGDEKLPTWTTLGLTYTRTQYLGRLAQNSKGQYTAEHQASDRVLLSLGYTAPIAANFSVKAQANFLWASSNQKYEATYRYTYNTANYLFGFTYDY